MKNNITIVIAEDHPVFRRGLAMMISTDSQLNVLADAGSGDEAIELIKEHKPDVAILDVNMPVKTGFDVVRELQSFDLATWFVLLTMHKDEGLFNTALDLGVKGYLLKESAVEEIIAGIKAVAAGENFISPQLATFLFNRGRRSANLVKQQPSINDLTPTERRVLDLIAEEKTSREIAADLYISHRTVERHRENICTKLDKHGSNFLIKFAIAHKSELL